jgi:D-xylulose reductase
VSEIPPTAQNDVIVRIKQTGIWGSDVHYYTHGSIGSFTLPSPMALGHESSSVSAVGVDVKTLSVGNCIAPEPGVP